MNNVLGKVLVTGGAGFIGSHTVDLLLEEGVEVRVLDNLSTGDLKNIPVDHPGLEFVQGDVRNIEDVADAMVGVTHCLHLAAQVSVAKSIEDPVHSSQCNVQGFLHVLEAARKNDVKRVVYASSAAVYGMPTYLPLDEEAPTNPISPYGLEKLIDEKYANLYAELYDLSTLGLRYFNVYGPRQDPSSPYSGVISIFTKNIRERKTINIFGDGKQTRDFIFVKDVAAANVAALKSDFLKACNIGTGKSVTLIQLLDVLEDVGGKIDKVFLNAREGDICNSSMKPTIVQGLLKMNALTKLEEGLTSLWKDHRNG